MPLGNIFTSDGVPVTPDGQRIAIDGSATTQPVSGTVTAVGSLTNNNAAPATTNIGVLPALANAANPTWTEGDQVLASVDLSGHQRVVTTGPTAGGVAATGNPVQIGAVYNSSLPTYTTGQTAQLQSNTKGALQIAIGVGQTAIADNKLSINPITDTNSNTNPLYVANSSYGGAFSGTADATRQGWSKVRTPTVFKTATATASGNTAVWTPGASNKFRLLRYQITVPGNAQFATTAGTVTITFQDNTTDLNIKYVIFVPLAAAATTNGVNFNSGWVDLGAFGELSAAAGNVLNVNLALGGTGAFTNGVTVIVAGVEE
jgi:hypothetical protein